jgi:ribose 5-phosphate isomerase A
MPAAAASSTTGPILHKLQAAVAALDTVRSDSIVGLGSGSTAAFFIAALGKALHDGRLHDVRGVATSHASADLAREAGVPVIDPSEAVEGCDVVVDGADEVDPNLDLIKGLGGALLREKVVAQASRRRVIVVDAGKRVGRLGERVPLPVEVLPFAAAWVEPFLRDLGGTVTTRRGDDGQPYVTDNGNFIYDVALGPIDDPARLEHDLLRRAGVVQTGLFLDMADEILVADAEGVQTLRRGT